MLIKVSQNGEKAGEIGIVGSAGVCSPVVSFPPCKADFICNNVLALFYYPLLINAD